MKTSPEIEGPVRSLYVQVPFCPERCDYCSIPVSIHPERAEGYLKALSLEKARIRSRLDLGSIRTLYLGGGTPTSLSPGLFSDLIDLLKEGLLPLGEFTVESRPDTLDVPMLKLLERKGVSRLSIGMEAASSEQMAFLGRNTNPYDISSMIEFVRNNFTGQISMDFIIGGMGYDPSLFRTISYDLLEAGLDHLSAYPLTLENRTVLTLRDARGELSDTLEEDAASFWKTATEDLRSMGWNQYEVANFSRNPETVCQHNLSVWKGESYLGMGAGAHQRVMFVRSENVRSYVSYEERLNRGESPLESREVLSESQAFLEVIYTNARLSYGIPKGWLDGSLDPYELSNLLSRMIDHHWIKKEELDHDRIVFTPEGWLFLDSLIGEFSVLVER
ncbi:MAG: coproporphyrinogen-III oxidase family protein [Leptospirales bacterium]